MMLPRAFVRGAELNEGIGDFLAGGSLSAEIGEDAARRRRYARPTAMPGALVNACTIGMQARWRSAGALVGLGCR